MRIALPLVVLIGLAACQSETAEPAAQDAAGDPAAVETPGAPQIAGTYTRTDPSNGELVVAPEGDAWRLTVVAGGVPDGAATAADCELAAVGPLEDGRVVGTLVAFEGEIGGLTDEDVADGSGTITAVFGEDGVVQVTEMNASSRHCGLGSDLSGTYGPAT